MHVYEDNVDLGLHVVQSDHIKAEPDGYYCYWKGCTRTKDNGGKPFDSLQKIVRHIKEVHMLKILAQKVVMDKLGANYFRRGAFLKDTPIKDTPLTETMPTPQQILQQATLAINPSTSAIGTTPTQQIKLPTTVVQATPTNSVSTATVATQTSPPTHNEKSDTPPNVFVPPPNNTRKVCHSQIYMK